MFLWAALPQGLPAMALFDLAVKDKVVFVPGDPFYVRGERPHTLRLNFSCADSATIAVGIERLGRAIRKLMARQAESAASLEASRGITLGGLALRRPAARLPAER